MVKAANGLAIVHLHGRVLRAHPTGVWVTASTVEAFGVGLTLRGMVMCQTKTLSFGILLLSLVGLMACGTATQHVAPIGDIDGRLAATEDGDFEALVAEAEQHWANRIDRAQLEAALAAWETATRVESPGNRRADLYPILCLLSRGYYMLADGHIRFDEGPEATVDASMMESYNMGIEYGRLAMAVNNDEWNRALLYETPIPEAAQVLTRSDLPAAYWYSVNMGKWAVLDGTPTILAHKDDIRAIMERIAEIDREYWYGASDRYFGVFYTRIPIGNPDLDRSHQHFEAAIAMAPDYLSTRVLYAQDYATKRQDRELFVEQLEYVLAADLDTMPEFRPENEIEQRKAQLLLDNVDEYFR